MANLHRFAKPCDAWSENELLAFNIRVVDVGISSFFDVRELPVPTVSATILTSESMPAEPLAKNTRLFYQYMSLVERPLSSQSHVDDFIAFLLHNLDYDDDDRVICRQTELSLLMSGERVPAKVDVCLIDEFQSLLVVDTDSVSGFRGDLEAKIIAKAIAAFYQNNLQRKQTGLATLQSRLIPALSMIGTAPIFYRVHVTTELLQAVATASFPQEETLVLRFIPPVPSRNRYRIDGMRPLTNRRIVLQYLEAFKKVI